MLTSFQVKRTFYKTKVTLYVDLEQSTPRVSLLATYAGGIVINEDLRPHDAHSIRSVEAAEAYLSRQVPVEGGTLSFVEAINWRYRKSEGV